MKSNLRYITLVLLMFFSTSCNKAGFQITDNNFPLEQTWSVSIGEFLFDYAVSEDLVVLGTSEGLKTLDAATGSLLWDNDFLVDSEPGSIAIFDDKLVAIDRQIVKVFTIGGEELMTFGINDNQGMAQIAALSGKYILLIRKSNWVLETYELNTGTYLWKAPVSRGGAEVYFDINLNRVFIVNSSDIGAYEATSGELLWQLSGKFRASAYQSGILFFYEEGGNNENDHITAYDVNRNLEVWSTSYSMEIKKISLYREMVLISTLSGIFAFDMAQGNLLWQFSPDEEFSSPVNGIDDQLFARGAISRTIYALSSEGRSIGTLQLGSPAFFAQTYTSYISDTSTFGNLLIFVVGNHVYAYEKK